MFWNNESKLEVNLGAAAQEALNTLGSIETKLEKIGNALGSIDPASAGMSMASSVSTSLATLETTIGSLGTELAEALKVKLEDAVLQAIRERNDLLEAEVARLKKRVEVLGYDPDGPGLSKEAIQRLGAETQGDNGTAAETRDAGAVGEASGGTDSSPGDGGDTSRHPVIGDAPSS